MARYPWLLLHCLLALTVSYTYAHKWLSWIPCMRSCLEQRSSAHAHTGAQCQHSTDNPMHMEFALHPDTVREKIQDAGLEQFDDVVGFTKQLRYLCEKHAMQNAVYMKGSEVLYSLIQNSDTVRSRLSPAEIEYKKVQMLTAIIPSETCYHLIRAGRDRGYLQDHVWHNLSERKHKSSSALTIVSSRSWNIFDSSDDQD